MMPVPVKICGLTREADIDVAIDAGAAFLGFIFYPPSKRALSIERWHELGKYVAGRVPKVGVFVNAEDDWINKVMEAFPLDRLQLHGKEPPERVEELKTRLAIPVIKAFAIAEEADVKAAESYKDHADALLFDAKPPKSPDAIPGGNGLAFDWRLLSGRDFGLPWLLSGGISASNLERAVELTGAPMLDLSSSVEDAPGLKNHGLMRALLAKAQNYGMP